MFLRRTPRRAHALQNTANEGSRRSLVRADRQSQIQRYSTGVVRPSSLHWQMSVVLRRAAMPLNESYHEEKLGRHRASSSYNVFRSEARAEMPAVKGKNKLCEPAQTTALLGPRGSGPSGVQPHVRGGHPASFLACRAVRRVVPPHRRSGEGSVTCAGEAIGCGPVLEPGACGFA